MNTERDKFLTEAMGECWHDCYNYLCIHCEKMFPDSNNNFSTWEGFGKLWKWSKKQEWFWRGVMRRIDHQVREEFVNPDTFADVIYNYLKEQQQ